VNEYTQWDEARSHGAKKGGQARMSSINMKIEPPTNWEGTL